MPSENKIGYKASGSFICHSVSDFRAALPQGAAWKSTWRHLSARQPHQQRVPPAQTWNAQMKLENCKRVPEPCGSTQPKVRTIHIPWAPNCLVFVYLPAYVKDTEIHHSEPTLTGAWDGSSGSQLHHPSIIHASGTRSKQQHDSTKSLAAYKQAYATNMEAKIITHVMLRSFEASYTVL